VFGAGTRPYSSTDPIAGFEGVVFTVKKNCEEKGKEEEKSSAKEKEKEKGTEGRAPPLKKINFWPLA